MSVVSGGVHRLFTSLSFQSSESPRPTCGGQGIWSGDDLSLSPLESMLGYVGMVLCYFSNPTMFRKINHSASLERL